MFIPMGTVVAVCMMLTVLFASRFPWLGLNKVSPPWLLRILGVIAVAAGLWNALWYGLRHLGEFWGHMALGSGVLLVLLGVLLYLPASEQPEKLNNLRPFAVVALLAFGLYYGWTLYRL